MPDIECPQCKNPIYDEDALSCHFCGTLLTRSSSGAIGKMRSAGMNWIWWTIAIVVIVGFMLSAIH